MYIYLLTNAPLTTGLSSWDLLHRLTPGCPAGRSGKLCAQVRQVRRNSICSSPTLCPHLSPRVPSRRLSGPERFVEIPVPMSGPLARFPLLVEGSFFRPSAFETKFAGWHMHWASHEDHKSRPRQSKAAKKALGMVRKACLRISKLPEALE